MEGPDDKIFMFLRVEEFAHKGSFPAADRIPEDLRYLAGHDMQELIKAEQTATRFALGRRGRMSYQVSVPKVDAYNLGQLIFWAETMTVLTGYLYGVNPFDQPGVELSKQYAYGLMGRTGFESFRKEIEEA
jgi:glucose-6-phosphate isomerase